jgi:hypothetical protein
VASNETLPTSDPPAGAKIPAASARAEVDSIWMILFKSGWPILGVVVVVGIMMWAATRGTPLYASFVDAHTWPGSGYGPCHPEMENCANVERRVYGTMIVFAAGLLTLASFFTYSGEVSRAERGVTRDDSLGVTMTNYVARALTFAACGANFIWTWTVIFLVPERYPLINEIMIIVIFVVFGLIDGYLMWGHVKDRYNEGRHEYDFFFGNLFFIDFPIVIGAIAVVIFVNLTTDKDWDEKAIIDATSAAAAVMHVALSQIVYAALQVQLRMKRQKYP